LVAVTFAAYAPVLRYGFVNLDDPHFTAGRIGDGLSRANLKWALSEFHFGFYYPLTLISHMLDRRLFQNWAGGHHLTSLLIHLANTLLLLTLLRRATKAPWRSFFAAALFALHPLHVESVAWVAERKDVLSTFFELLAFHAYIRYAEKRSAGRYLAVFLGFALALLSKSMVVTFPFLLLLADYWPLGRLDFTRAAQESAGGTWRTLGNLVLEKVPLFALIPVSAWLTLLAQTKEKALSSTSLLPLDQRFANAILSYGRYILKMFAPFGLVAYVPHPQGHYSMPLVVLSALFLAACTVAVLVLWRRFRYLPFGWFWYLGSLIPVIGLIQTGQIASADRFTYVPLVGLFIILSWGACDAMRIPNPGKRVEVWGAAILLLLSLAALTRFQVTTWSSDGILYRRILAYYPQCALAHYNLGHSLFDEGRIEEAIAHYTEAVRLDPDYVEAQNNLGVALIEENRLPEALDHLNQALRINPDSAQALGDLGLALGKMNRLSESIERLEQAVKIDPDFADARINLGVSLNSAGRAPEALEQFQQALKIQPASARALGNLLAVLVKLNRLPEGIERFQQAVREKPDSPEARFNLGMALFQAGRFAEARENFRQALEIRPDFTQARASLQEVEKHLQSAH